MRFLGRLIGIGMRGRMKLVERGGLWSCCDGMRDRKGRGGKGKGLKKVGYIDFLG